MKRKFTWLCWNWDCSDASSYIIAKDECPDKAKVPQYIVAQDGLNPSILRYVPENLGMFLSIDDVKEGWCKWQVRTDWDNYDGPHGGYIVEAGNHKHPYPGWFPVWIVKIGEWY